MAPSWHRAGRGEQEEYGGKADPDGHRADVRRDLADARPRDAPR
jgi:hypothetical protein